MQLTLNILNETLTLGLCSCERASEAEINKTKSSLIVFKTIQEYDIANQTTPRQMLTH